MKVKQMISTAVINEGIRYVEKNPLENMEKLLNWGEKILITDNHKSYARSIRDILDDPSNNWNEYICRLFTEFGPNVRKKVLVNFLVNASILGIPTNEKMSEKYGCNIPWAILMDPTAACNLKCTGCWAAEYKKTASMDIKTLDRIIREGKELGIYMYIYSGGEPLICKDDLMKLAHKHNDCMFLAFSNGTLVNDDLAAQMAAAGNFALALSVEGFESETDMRRGDGTYQRVIEAMDILRKHGVPFGFSTCYHSGNVNSVGSDQYVDYMIEKGCIFGWYFTYMPLGKGAQLDLIATPEQRAYMYHRVREFRNTKPIFLMDFWNDGDFAGGCIAGGRRYLHINANGDVEPCAFIHYSNVNIKDVSLLDALQSPLFMQYRLGQPFNDNLLRPCPLLDNPHKLREMVHLSGAQSTQPIDLEDVDELTERTMQVALEWGKVADQLWEQNHCAADLPQPAQEQPRQRGLIRLGSRDH
ncbi:Aldolase-type TIM barrel [Syntrophomonas zehnderi OL-4]|uniref:Aldolase-type TIM barrel n=1 Tax=Syntrophomonas zehnderi OL-4 TaxID=690567 RepID=A0A0E4C897_9FIRM|nr:radical SAM protein [Syntrophomonas zehnderi]CFX05511.1 Aldolase-type TIM barrel [Syntrophomonas zehnderi OL-4]CFX34641.1 Aldolase-type TIM barrel [Syntrophomonas zehnderi OL-4]